MILKEKPLDQFLLTYSENSQDQERMQKSNINLIRNVVSDVFEKFDVTSIKFHYS